MQKIRIIGFFFRKIGYIDSVKWKKFLQTAILGYTYIEVQIKHYSGDDHQLSPLTRIMGIPCLIWEHPLLLLFIVCTRV